MKTHLENFRTWYVAVLNGLYPLREAGFVVLMITFPLLERYLRQKQKQKQKLQLPPQAILQDSFYDELAILFPQLPDRATAKNFWQVYRNGILHEVTLYRQNRSGSQMPTGWLSHDKPIISIESDGSFWIHPVLFAQHVVQTIEADFSVFEGTVVSQSPLPKIKTVTTPAGPIILGTNTDP
jgi:hypothetical protein